MPRSYNPLSGFIESYGIQAFRNAGAPGVSDVKPTGSVWVNTITNDIYMQIAAGGDTPVWSLISTPSGIVTSIATGAGTAVPAAGVITIADGEGIDTSAAGSTVTIACEDWSTSNKGVGTLASDAEVQAGTISNEAITPSGLNSLLSLEKNTGFVSWGGAGSYYTISGTDFTLDRTGTGYIKGKKVDWAGGQTLAGLTVGATTYVYIDTSGIIGGTTSATQATYEDYIILFEAWVDASIVPVVTVVKENHPYSVQTDVSHYLHRSIGTIIQNASGGANITLHGTKALQIVGDDILEDHGLETTIPNSAAAAVTINWCYTNVAGKWVRYLQQTTTPSVYNNGGTPTALTAGRYGVWRIYVSKDDLETATPTYYAVMHTAQYNNLTQARNAITAGIAAATNELASLELAQLGYIIFSQTTDSIVEVQIQKSILRGTTTGAGSSNLASLISLNTTNFAGHFDSTTTNVQVMADIVDDLSFDVVSDTTPQLGGDLDVNGHSIVSTAAGNIAITPDGAGVVVLDGLSWPTADGTAGQFMTTNGGGVLSFGNPVNCIVTTYNANGTHTLNARTKFVHVYMWSGGAGGGSGRRGAAGANRYGGGGGAPGTSTQYFLTANQFTSPAIVTIGAGGLGGAARLVDNQDGNDGVFGNISDVASSLATYVNSVPGKKGTATSGTGGTQTSSYLLSSIIYTITGGAAGSSTTGGTSTQSTLTFSPTGGGGGGGITAANAVANGGVGGKKTNFQGTQILAGGIAGVAGAVQDGGIGQDGVNGAAWNFSGGTGGGGGASNKTADAGAGGKGGWPAGGGGGGGASVNGFASGAGGNGGDGGVIIVEYL